MSPNTCFLYKITPTRLEMVTARPTAEEDLVLDDHFDYLKGLALSGALVLAGRTTNNDATTFGLVLLWAESEAAARQIMEADPAVKQGVMRAELYPYRIALAGELPRE